MTADTISAELRQVLRTSSCPACSTPCPNASPWPARTTCPTKSSSPWCSPMRSPAGNAARPPPGPTARLDATMTLEG
jgi:hypothetical protein